MPTPRETILAALHARLSVLPATALRGEVLPFLRLRDEFELDGEPSTRQSVVVVQYAGHKVGLVVDRLHGEFQTVIKPLGPLFRNLRGIGGSTILGSGEVGLILDVPLLARRASRRAPPWRGHRVRPRRAAGARPLPP